jgi:putative peptidoglycan lipid II flippase
MVHLLAMDRRRIASAAAIIMLGNLTTSLLGFVRAFVVAHFFGDTAKTDAFFAALVVPQMFYDLLIGGAIAAALIPSFTRLAGEDERELWRVVGTIFTLVTVVLVVVILILEAVAHPLIMAIASGFVLHAHAGTLPLAVKLVRLLLPALLFMGLSAVALATLYSLHRRVVASFASACYHLGIIVAAVLASARWGIVALPVGAVAGAALQFVVQIPSLARAKAPGASLRLYLDLRHPLVRRIVRLYAPVAAGIVVSIFGQVADVNFKSHLPQVGGLSSMQYATQLIQFPVGIIVAALGLAVLPSISTDAALARLDDFKDTLALGFRLALLLMVPAMVGFLMLATPIVTLLFQHGKFTHLGTVHTVTALMGYAPQLPFVGIDQLLIFAFYARHNTVTPMLVGVVGVVIYVSTAALLIGPLTIFGLALANTIQIVAHTLILLFLLVRTLGWFSDRKLTVTTTKICVASGVMAAAIFGSERWLTPGNLGHYTHLAAVIVPMFIAIVVYGALVVLLRVEEVHLLWKLLVKRLRGKELPPSRCRALGIDR